MPIIRYFRFAVILVVMEICYFLSGYIFWYNHDVLNFLWSSQYSYFPSYYSNGFWIIPLLLIVPFLILEKYGTKVIVRENLIIGFLFLGSFVNAFSLWRIPEINPDMILYNSQARYVVDHSILSFMLEFGKNYGTRGLPLPSLIFGLAYSLFGIHRYAIQLVNSILFSLIVVLGYLIAKELFTREVGVYSGIILLSSPFMISQAPLTSVDVATTFFVTLSIYQLVRMMKRPGPLSSVLAAVTVFLASLCKVTSLFFLFPVLLILCVIMILRSRQRLTVLSVLVFSTTLALLVGTMTLPFYMTIASHIRRGLTGASNNPFLNIISHPVLLTGPYWVWGRITIIAIAILKSLVLSITIPVFLLALLMLSFVFLKKDKTRIASCLLLTTWIIVPTMYTLDPSTLWGGARYMMPAYPAYAILAASFLTIFKDKRLRRMICVSILVFSIVSAQIMYGYAWGESPSRNLMHAAETVQPLIAQGKSIRVCFDYAAAWMSIYEPSLYPKGDPFDLSSHSLFSCINPNDKLPHYLVLVRARGEIFGHNYFTYTMSPEESQFLIKNYLRIMTFEGGALEGPWVDTTVEVFILQTSAGIVAVAN